MGFYSTFTYIGITAVSAINRALTTAAGPASLCVLLGLFLLPSFGFLAWLARLLAADRRQASAAPCDQGEAIHSSPAEGTK